MLCADESQNSRTSFCIFVFFYTKLYKTTPVGASDLMFGAPDKRWIKSHVSSLRLRRLCWRSFIKPYSSSNCLDNGYVTVPSCYATLSDVTGYFDYCHYWHTSILSIQTTFFVIGFGGVNSFTNVTAHVELSVILEQITWIRKTEIAKLG